MMRCGMLIQMEKMYKKTNFGYVIYAHWFNFDPNILFGFLHFMAGASKIKI